MRYFTRLPLCALLLAGMFLGLGANCFGGPKVRLGANVDRARLVSIDQVDHSAWDALLRRYVDQEGNVAYAQWHRSPADIQALDSYLASLSAASPQTQANASAKLAFWINAYNAVTVRGILREYPTTSIRNHTPKVLGYNIWDDLLLPVGGRDYSLNQIEHEVLRKLGEPRIHFAIVCASISCPRLLNQAYTAERLESQLVANTKHFFANSRNFRFDASRRQMHLSAILSWFGEDFGGSQTERLRAIAPYLPTRAAYDAALSGQVAIQYLDYDWGLNDQATQKRSASR